MRGKGAARVRNGRRSGITPAYAGKSPARPALRRWRWDHPRVCGEKFTQSATKTTIPGSPPRMRGKEISRDGTGYRLGITPAYAGKSYGTGGGRDRAGDHPRVCGEKSGQKPWKHVWRGSPPRMRGKVDSIETGDLVHGITPAYAGKSNIWWKVRPFSPDHPRVCGEKSRP